MREHNEDDELEIGEITERDSPDRITRPPNDELIEYDRGNKRNEIASSGGGIGEERDRQSKRLYGVSIVIAILCISTIFLYSAVNNLGNKIDCINQSLMEQIGEMREDYDDRIGEMGSKIKELEKLLPPNYNGTVSLNKSTYHINESATVTVNDKDRNINSKVRETVNVLVRNTNTSEQISIILTETGQDTGEFIGTFTFANETNNTLNRIGVGINDTIEILYKDEKTEENTPTNRIVKVIIKQVEP
ncbi:MAG: hypothetical protein N2V75_05010 [Methanophagales archaeon]|nr:hypothetical protein [Methanophagales archaeon]